MFRELLPWLFVALHCIIFLIHEVHGGQWGFWKIGLTIVTFIAIIGVPLFVWAETRRRWQKRLQVTSSSLHNVSDNIRNHYFSILKAEPDQDMYACGQQIVDKIKESLEHLTGRTSHVSIIIADNPQSEPQLPDNTTVFLLCRSANNGTAVRRLGDDESHKLEEYSPLWDIINEGIPYYAKTWIVRKQVMAHWIPKTHRDPNTKWASDYNAVMAVPIRIKRIYLADKDRGVGEFVVAGFIWCDWSARFPFWKWNRGSYANLLLSIADGFFHYLERVKEVKTDS